MAAFDAGSAVAPMDWDFSKFGAGKGTVPEPSDIEIERFMKKYRILATQVLAASEDQTNLQITRDIEQRTQAAEDGRTTYLTVAQSLEVMNQVDVSGEDVSPEISDAMVELVLTITKGSPGKDQILALPNRVRGAFYGWLIGELTNPDFSVTAGTTPSLSLVNGG
jgi:hypothetical protein